ncbi:MAG: hypothetical protein V4510_13450 [bacterium]
MSAWIARDRKRVADGDPPRLDVRYEGRNPMLLAADVIQLAHDLHKRENARIDFLASLQPGFDA